MSPPAVETSDTTAAAAAATTPAADKYEWIYKPTWTDANEAAAVAAAAAATAAASSSVTANDDDSKKVVLRMWNRYDGFPHGVGRYLLRDLLTLIPLHGLDGLSEKFSKLRVVSPEDQNLTAEDMTRFAPYKNEYPAKQYILSGTTFTLPLVWSDMTYKLQGQLALTLENGAWVQDDNDDNPYVYTIDQLIKGRLSYTNRGRRGWNIPLKGNLALLKEWLNFLSNGGATVAPVKACRQRKLTRSSAYTRGVSPRLTAKAKRKQQSASRSRRSST